MIICGQKKKTVIIRAKIKLGIKSVENMTKENKARLIKFLWNLASAILAAVGTALGVSCAVMA